MLTIISKTHSCEQKGKSGARTLAIKIT